MKSLAESPLFVKGENMTLLLIILVIAEAVLFVLNWLEFVERRGKK